MSTDFWTVWGLSQTHVFHQVKNWASLKPWSLLTCIWALVPIHLKNIENLMLGCTSKPVLLNRLQDYFCLFQQSSFLIDLVTKKTAQFAQTKTTFPIKYYYQLYFSSSFQTMKLSLKINISCPSSLQNRSNTTNLHLISNVCVWAYVCCNLKMNTYVEILMDVKWVKVEKMILFILNENEEEGWLFSSLIILRL